jgi:hypothetical protein
MLHPTITICTYVVKTLLVYQRLVAVGSLKFLCFLSHWNQTSTVCSAGAEKEEQTNKQVLPYVQP